MLENLYNMPSPLDLVFGQKPKVAKPRYVDLSAEQKKALQSDITSFPDQAKLGGLYTSYLQGEIEKQLPGYSQILKGGAQTTQEMLTAAQPLLEGQIPQDIQDQIRRTDAFQSLMSGEAGSPMARSLVARDFGLTSLQLEQQGAQLAGEAGNAAQQWSKIAGQTIYNPSSMFVTPAQQAAVTSANNLLRQNYQQMKYNIAAAPDPAAKGISDTVISLVEAYLSKGGGGGGTPSGPSSSSRYGIGVNQIPSDTNQSWQSNASGWGQSGSPGNNFVPVSDIGGWNYDPNQSLYGGF
jgi:hypothetical protein